MTVAEPYPASVEWLSVRQVCDELQVSRLVVLTLIQSGVLPAVRQVDKPGRPWFVARAALEAWLDGQRSATRRFVEDHPVDWNSMWDPDTAKGPTGG